MALRALDAIVTEGLCVGCGLCASLAGSGRVEMRWTGEGRLRPVARTKLDRATLRRINQVCPGLHVEGMDRATAGPGAAFDPAFGYAQAMWRGWAGDPEVRFKAAAGGALSALSIFLLESGQVDFIAHVKSPAAAPLRNVPHVSVNRAEVMEGLGSRYAPVAPLLHLMEHLDRGRPFAVVAKPCDISAIRNLAKTDVRVDRLVKALMTISCAGESDLNFTWRMMNALGVEEDELALMRYRGHGCPGENRFETKDGRVFCAPYVEGWGEKKNWHLQFRCKLCMDPVGEQADVVSFDVWPGGSPVGEDEGFSGIAARTPRGRALVEGAAKAGALALERPFTFAEFRDTQPHQVWKKNGILGRQIGLFLAGRIVPRFPGLRVVRMAWMGGVRHTIKNARGLLQRARAGGTAEPAP